MRIPPACGLIFAAAVLNAACSDHLLLTAASDRRAGPSLDASTSTTQVFEIRSESAFADYIIETLCEFKEVVIVGSEDASLGGGGTSFGELGFVSLQEFDNCTGGFSSWQGLSSSGFTQTGVKSATLSTPITLTNAETGETRSFTVNLKWTGTGEVDAQPGHFSDVSDGQRALFHVTLNSRPADVTTAQLIDSNGANLLAGAALNFALLSNSTNGSITITYP